MKLYVPALATAAWTAPESPTACPTGLQQVNGSPTSPVPAHHLPSHLTNTSNSTRSDPTHVVIKQTPSASTHYTLPVPTHAELRREISMAQAAENAPPTFKEKNPEGLTTELQSLIDVRTRAFNCLTATEQHAEISRDEAEFASHLGLQHSDQIHEAFSDVIHQDHDPRALQHAPHSGNHTHAARPSVDVVKTTMTVLMPVVGYFGTGVMVMIVRTCIVHVRALGVDRWAAPNFGANAHLIYSWGPAAIFLSGRWIYRQAKSAVIDYRYHASKLASSLCLSLSLSD